MASRTISAALLTALSAERVFPMILAEGIFDSGALRVWNGTGSLDALGETWVGTGLMLSISPIEETAELRAAGVNIGLSGIPSALVSIALAEDYQGRPARIYIGAFDDSTGAVIVDPIKVFEGRIDTMPIQDSGETATIIITVESRLIRLESASRRRFTVQDQKIEFPNDKGLNHVAAIQDVQIVWGAPSPQLGSLGFGGFSGTGRGGGIFPPGF